jgi:hypothetical protein
MDQRTRAAFSGLTWGSGVTLISPYQFGDNLTVALAICIGAFSGTLIGLAVYFVSRRKYLKWRFLGLILGSLTTLYVTAAIWGAGVGAVHRFIDGPLVGWGVNSVWGEIEIQAFLYCAGMTESKLVIILLPLAALNHLWLRKFELNEAGIRR